MTSAYYDRVFAAPVTNNAKAWARRRHQDEAIDAEFGDAGRDPRFLPGWYIVPLLLTWILAVAVYIIT